MGNILEKDSQNNISEIETKMLRFASIKQRFRDVNIPLNQPLDVQLIPQFATTDTPGKSVHYKLQLRFDETVSRYGDQTEELSTSSGNADKNLNGFAVIVELTETVTRECKKLTIGIPRRTSIVKHNSWTGRSSDVTREAKRIRLKGRLQNDAGNSSLDLDLILCPSELIIPESSNDWSLIGSLYVNNLEEKKDYKWRAAVPRKSNTGTENT